MCGVLYRASPELENGKCIACGDVEYKVKKDMSINMQVAYLALFFIILVLIFAAYSILTQ